MTDDEFCDQLSDKHLCKVKAALHEFHPAASNSEVIIALAALAEIERERVDAITAHHEQKRQQWQQ